MAVALCVVLAFMALGAGYWFARKRRRRPAMNDPLTQVFRRQEYRELDGRLERVAMEDLRRPEVNTRFRCTATDPGSRAGTRLPDHRRQSDTRLAEQDVASAGTPQPTDGVQAASR
jgi:hypothetical protein